jgi:hypothetical protein
VGLLAALLVALGMSIGVAAQEDAPLLGSPVSYVGADGVELGTITVTDVLDPFTGFPEGSEPEPGSKYVVLHLTFEGSLEGGFEVLYYRVWARDTAGALWEPGFPAVPDVYPVGELSSGEIGPGDRVSGYVGYVIPDDVSVDDVFFSPEDGVFLRVADLLASESPAVGTPVTMAETSEGAVGIGTVRAIDDPYKGFDKDRPPVDGARFVMATISFESTGDSPFAVEPQGIVLRDVNGNLWARFDVTPAKKPKIPVLASAGLATGDVKTGRVSFQVPANVALDGLYYQSGGRFFQLADLGAGTPPIAADCEGVEAWLTATLARLDRATEMSLEDAALDDPQGLEPHRAEYAELAVAQAADPVPATAQPINDLIVSALDAYATALGMIATADPESEDIALVIVEAVNTFNGAGTSIGDARTQITQLATTCT